MKPEEIMKPNKLMFKEWSLNEILSVTHKPNGTLHPKSLGEGYHFRVTESGIAMPLAACLAGFLKEQNHHVNGDHLTYGVIPVDPIVGSRIMGMPIWQVIKYRSVIDHGVDVGVQKLGSDVRYVLEPDKNGREFMQQARNRDIGILLHEGMHPLRGELPKFMNWLYEQKAIPQIG